MSTKKIRKPGKNAIPGYTLIPKGEYYQVRKIGMEPGRVNTDPVFANTRKQNADFATMSRITGLLRKTLENGTGIKTSIALLSKALWKMLKADYRSRYGQRTPLYGPQEWLEGVNCNTGSTLKEVLGGDILVKVSERATIFTCPFREAPWSIRIKYPSRPCNIKYVSCRRLSNWGKKCLASPTIGAILIPWTRFRSREKWR